MGWDPDDFFTETDISWRWKDQASQAIPGFGGVIARIMLEYGGRGVLGFTIVGTFSDRPETGWSRSGLRSARSHRYPTGCRASDRRPPLTATVRRASPTLSQCSPPSATARPATSTPTATRTSPISFCSWAIMAAAQGADGPVDVFLHGSLRVATTAVIGFQSRQIALEESTWLKKDRSRRERLRTALRLTSIARDDATAGFWRRSHPRIIFAVIA